MPQGKIKCVVVDDEPLARNILETFISRIESLELVLSCKSAFEAYNVIQKENIDLVFLDIQMPELTGTEFLKELSISPLVIFTTAYHDYALEAYNLDVIDYLVKPIEFSRFLKAVNKSRRLLKPLNESIINISTETPIPIDAFIYLKVEKRMQKIYLKDILYIESARNYVKVKVPDREIIAYKSLSYITGKLPSKKFLRVHRSFIISIDHIDSFSPNEIQIKEYKIPVGRQYRDMVKNQLGYY